MVRPRSLLRATVLAVAACIASAVTAAAPLVPVRSGEHATFSRLVFADAPGRSWSIVRTEPSRVQIVLSDGAPDLDLGQVFDFIPRRRIVAAAASDGVLTLTLGCGCTVEVSQIPTGHVVIDIQDVAPVRPAAVIPALARAVLPPVLPLRDMRLSLRPASASLRVLEAPPIAGIGPPQVRRHQSGPVPLVLDRQEPAAGQPVLTNCEVEPVARDAFLADPSIARAALDGGISALLDGEDRLDPNAIRSLAHGYLAAGWGAEAAQTAALDPSDDGIVAIVAAALDDRPLPAAARLDPACGPATTILALLDPSGTDDWGRADTTDLVRFVDRLPPFTFAQLSPRLAERLDQLGEGDLLSGFNLEEDRNPDMVPIAESAAAGTDAAAVGAAIALLEQANAQGVAAPEPYLVNALALRPSLPDGPLRRSLEAALSTSLVLSRRPSEAVAMVLDGSADADVLVTLAFDNLPTAGAAEFAVRLRPYLDASSAVSRRASDTFAQFGLAEAARSFAAVSADVLPRAVPADTALADPWLARDMAKMARIDPADWTDRNRLAHAIVERNTTPVPGTDLAAAGVALERSRAVSQLIAKLLDTEVSGVTAR